MNVQHRTSNFQLPMKNKKQRNNNVFSLSLNVGCCMLNVGSSSFFTCFYLLQGQTCVFARFLTNSRLSETVSPFRCNTKMQGHDPPSLKLWQDRRIVPSYTTRIQYQSRKFTITEIPHFIRRGRPLCLLEINDFITLCTGEINTANKCFLIFIRVMLFP